MGVQYLRFFAMMKACNISVGLHPNVFGDCLDTICRLFLAATGNYGRRNMFFVPVDRIWYLEMPSALIGRREYKKILRRLKKFESLGPQFWQQDLMREVRFKYFDYRWYARNTNIYYRTVTKRWGWTVRDLSDASTTEFYSIYKTVNFCCAQAILREHVINEFNRFFKRLRIDCEIKVCGLPKAREIVEIRNELLEGRISFRDALDRVRL